MRSWCEHISKRSKINLTVTSSQCPANYIKVQVLSWMSCVSLFPGITSFHIFQIFQILFTWIWCLCGLLELSASLVMWHLDRARRCLAKQKCFLILPKWLHLVGRRLSGFKWSRYGDTEVLLILCFSARSAGFGDVSGWATSGHEDHSAAPGQNQSSSQHRQGPPREHTSPGVTFCGLNIALYFCLCVCTR